MSEQIKKTPFFKGLLNAFKPAIRGVVKSIPAGNIVVETYKNVKAIKDGEAKPHTWISIVIQALCIGGIFYAFYTKQIDVNQLLSILKQLIG